MSRFIAGVDVPGALSVEQRALLSPEALDFLARLHRKFNSVRENRLEERRVRQQGLDAGRLPDFLDETRDLRETHWRVASTPADLLERRVEITGPVERKMMINALNSGASVFMADFEDALSPTWENVLQGQLNCRDAVRRTLTHVSAEGKKYELRSGKLATFVVRPRGWHLIEPGIVVDGQPMSASLFDFGLYFFHNARELIERRSGPYFYLAKLESHFEARLWRDVFAYAEAELGIPLGTIRATVLVETVLAAFEMDEILYELRDYVAGLNAGRWDYIFSIIKKLGGRGNLTLPDRKLITMDVPFMRAYAQLVVKTCHARGAHAIGGMSAFVPSRRDASVNAVALEKVREDKRREASDGFDGTWVAHPDLVPVALEAFERVLGSEPHQKHRSRADFKVTASELLDFGIPGAKITEAGVTSNISVALEYLANWMAGTGAVTINNLMEDAATAEIARAQLWLWVRQRARMEDGRLIAPEFYRAIRAQEVERLRGKSLPNLVDAAAILDVLVLASEFHPFLTSYAMPFLRKESMYEKPDYRSGIAQAS